MCAVIYIKINSYLSKKKNDKVIVSTNFKILKFAYIIFKNIIFSLYTNCSQAINL